MSEHERPELIPEISPNLISHEYRNAHAVQTQPHLQVITNYDDDSIILGASNMVDRIWDGRIWFYTEVKNFERDKFVATLHMESGVNAMAYIGRHDRFVVCEDSGNLSVFSYDPEINPGVLNCMGYACQHDDSIVTVASFSSSPSVVTGGLDACLKVWDIENLVPTYDYMQAHVDSVSCVDIPISSTHVFISTSRDCEALIWDTRKPKPAMGIWKTDLIPLTAVACKKDDPNAIAVGGLDGSISLLDLRKLKEKPLLSCVLFPRGVHRLLYSSKNADMLAGCCDALEVKVFDTSRDCHVAYESITHSHFVRGLAWYQNDLFTCSWDDSIQRHHILV